MSGRASMNVQRVLSGWLSNARTCLAGDPMHGRATSKNFLAASERAVRPASLAASARLSLFVAALSKVDAAPEFTGLKNSGACSSGYGVQVLQAPIKAVHSSANPNTEARRAGFGLLASGATQRTMRAGRVSSGARSNPSINRTRNGGSPWLASVASVAPLRAGYLKR